MAHMLHRLGKALQVGQLHSIGRIVQATACRLLRDKHLVEREVGREPSGHQRGGPTGWPLIGTFSSMGATPRGVGGVTTAQMRSAMSAAFVQFGCALISASNVLIVGTKLHLRIAACCI